MSVVVEISNLANLKKAKDLLGAKTDNETLELALARVIDELEPKEKVREPEDDLEVDVHTLNRIPPKKSFKVKAKVRLGGRGKPLKYDLSDYNFEENDE